MDTAKKFVREQPSEELTACMRKGYNVIRGKLRLVYGLRAIKACENKDFAQAITDNEEELRLYSRKERAYYTPAVAITEGCIAELRELLLKKRSGWRSWFGS
jgi:hypothetical protein